MDKYLDIRVLSNPEVSSPILMNALFGKLHRRLMELRSETIGVSFPKHDNTLTTLGSTLRLHGNFESLEQLMADNWLKGIGDHVNFREIHAVPNVRSYRVVRRVQVKSSPERLRRRYEKRHKVSGDQALAVIPDGVAKRLNLPFVTLQSRSTGQRFPLFINHETKDSPNPGKFGYYGLSQDATVPWF